MVPPRIASTMKWDRVRMNMATHGPVFTRLAKSCFGSDFCLGSGLMRSFVVRNVMRKRTTQTVAHSAMVICQPFALSPCPNLATSGSVKPPTINCAIIAETNRYEDRLVRSLMSPVITPVIAEYGVLLAEYNVINRTLVAQAQSSLPV